ncbi:TPA: hypothetical protein DCZ46_01135 [Candidatus Campbellbacteria bacterium]|nr:MAG: seg [Candidatus Campbellbacteria bacterium GW2011_OD1_34_28]KKP75311.1 MAG: hypothetical protein UR74_C0001G0167 [Candidatus Campbellbacteria bacterium GW2011_GWD2_35_24]KKP76128.1 MAG: hypothetical protein UR75_C0001G0162 [Candidatus Campbellbacteria bacterium GW2011_GWC2_35_28]KKP77317.1 MAG: hypothetical protein UR76_C0001G0162 [Candidatus Campbellbacteria bacterium GW2011_GWC1_35_31]KKP79246.1 MAG: hypothetical protein UR79_C0001G0162 [Candidatus Campbellbacteria bacterium GW2011_GW
MLIHTIGIFIVMGIITAFVSQLSEIPVLDIILLSTILSPLALLQKGLHGEKQDFIYSGSIIFRKYSWLFRLFSLIFTIIFFVTLYYYGQTNGFGVTIILFFTASIVQGAYYALIKSIVPGEVFLIPLEIIGLILFHTLVL